MYRLREFLYRFMQGRYGNDELNKFLLWSYVFFVAVNLFVNSIIIVVLYSILSVVFIYRIMSKDYYKRQQENGKYLLIRNKALKQFTYINNKWKYRKTYIYRKCPNCKAPIRLPRKEGKHICCCPACKKDFEVKCR